MALSTDEISNLTKQIMTEYNLEEEKHSKNIREILKTHGNQPFYTLRYISFVKNFLILSKVGKYTIEVPSRREHCFLNRLTNSCFFQVKNRRTDKAALCSEYYDEVFLTIDVFR